jgi:hypothetical protein
LTWQDASDANAKISVKEIAALKHSFVINRFLKGYAVLPR